MIHHQKAARKDIERLFGCLRGRFKILCRESVHCNLVDLVETSKVCVIVHSMLVKLRFESLMTSLTWR